jgi:hypothetical protein
VNEYEAKYIVCECCSCAASHVVMIISTATNNEYLLTALVAVCLAVVWALLLLY